MPLGPFRDVNNRTVGDPYNSIAQGDDGSVAQITKTKTGRYGANLERTDHFQTGLSQNGRPRYAEVTTSYNPAEYVNGGFRTPARAKIATAALANRVESGGGDEYRMP